MAILKWKRTSSPEAEDSWSLLERFQDDWDRLFGWSRFPQTAGLFDRTVTPAIDVVETEKDIVVWADVPGLDRKDLDLSVTGNVLTLKGEKKVPSKADEDKDRVYRDETWTGNFHRSLSLPVSADPQQVSA